MQNTHQVRGDLEIYAKSQQLLFRMIIWISSCCAEACNQAKKDKVSQKSRVSIFPSHKLSCRAGGRAIALDELLTKNHMHGESSWRLRMAVGRAPLSKVKTLLSFAG